jgi:hypothetical protein
MDKDQGAVSRGMGECCNFMVRFQADLPGFSVLIALRFISEIADRDSVWTEVVGCPDEKSAPGDILPEAVGGE